MAVFIGAIKKSDLKEGSIFRDKSDGTVVKILSVRLGYDVYTKKRISIVYYKVVDGKGNRYTHTGVIGHTTLQKFKKEYQP
jgi:hypothetical protein